MRRIPLYGLTLVVGIGLAYSFVAPFQGALDAPVMSDQDVSIVPENFEMPEEMKNEAAGNQGQPDGAGDMPDDTQTRQVVPGDKLSPGQPAPLERIEPRAPLGDIGQAAPPAPPPPAVPVDEATAKPVLLYRPVATAAGTIEASGYRISLEGIDALAPEETCRSDGDVAWPCGMAARTALRSWLRSRAIECAVPGQPSEELIATQCRLGTTDVAAWLVSNGWARARKDTPLAEMMKKAEEERRGIFGSPPPALPATGNLQPPPLDNEPAETGEPVQAPPPLTTPDAPFPPRPQ
ncbi:MAG: thermonuclease family protein [Phyllobacterium sp.]